MSPASSTVLVRRHARAGATSGGDTAAASIMVVACRSRAANADLPACAGSDSPVVDRTTGIHCLIHKSNFG